MMKFYTHEQILEEFIGKKGTQERDKFDAEVHAAVEAYKMGEALRAERERMNLTQRQLGEKAGVGERTVSKVENGHSTSTTSLFRIFHALELKDSFLDMGRLGRVALL